MGNYYTFDGLQHAFTTDPNGGGLIVLDMPGESFSQATGINDAGQVIGFFYTDGFQEHAFITGSNGVGITDLNSLVHLPAGVILTEAMAINNMGQVVANAIPEPETYALMLAGLALMGVMVRRK